MLNYFTTLGDANDNNDGDPTAPAAARRSTTARATATPSPAAATSAVPGTRQDLDRQQAKIVAAINALDADVVGLMEIENSAELGETANEAVKTLVAALNADAGAGAWAANPSSAELPAASNEMDVIPNAIIYKPASVDRVGPSLALGDQSTGNDTATDEAFANAREPLGSGVRAGGDGGEEFLVVVNHFKSKGSAGPFAGDTDQR